MDIEEISVAPELENQKTLELEKEIGRLRQIVSEQNQKLAQPPPIQIFIEKGGILFPKTVGNGYVNRPYCVRCIGPLSTASGSATCPKCSANRIGVRNSEIRAMAKELGIRIDGI